MEKEIKQEITERWVNAVDYLIDKGLLKSYVELELRTGILNQRVADYKRFIKGNGRPSFVSVDQVYLLHKNFNVSLKYMICNQGSIIKNGSENKATLNSSDFSPSTDLHTSMSLIENSGRIQVLENKVKALENVIADLLMGKG